MIYKNENFVKIYYGNYKLFLKVFEITLDT